MSGSPHGVFGWTQPFGVSMKWLASLGGPRIDCPSGVLTKPAARAAPSSAVRIGRKIRCIVTPCRGRLSSSRGIFMSRLGRLSVALWTLFTASFFAQTNGVRAAKPYTTWTAYGGGAHSAQYSALDQINRSNLSQLQVAWTFPVTGTV